MNEYKWTQRDTDICERAEASGLALNKHTGKFVTIKEMKEISKDYDSVRDIMSIEDFMAKRIIAVPFEDKDKYD